MSVVVFKPDEIGDFVMACSAIRRLAAKHGEENTTLIVKSELAGLARREFPHSPVIALPWRRRQKGKNQAAANIRSCFPAWRILRRTKADQMVCLRSQRNYLQTLFFASPNVTGRFAPENTLLLSGKWRRILAERLLRIFKTPVLVPYPEPCAQRPSEVEAHRLVLSAALDREVQLEEVMPRLRSASWRGGGSWLVCPFSSRGSKDYDAKRWAEALRACVRPPLIRLAGGQDQAARLEEFATALRSEGVACPVEIVPPRPLETFPDLVAESGLVLTVDTSAAHFACALGAPAVIVHCGLHGGVYGPYSPNGRQVWLMGDYGRLGSKRWRESVTPTMVADAIGRALAA
jgi:ADP-heptose:LPS heptosyltransferase